MQKFAVLNAVISVLCSAVYDTEPPFSFGWLITCPVENADLLGVTLCHWAGSSWHFEGSFWL